MVAKFSASEARQTVELAKQHAKKQAELDKRQADLDQQANEARKRDEDALREKKARIQESIDQGWAAQKTLIIDAAVHGKKNCTLNTPIYRYKDLIVAGLGEEDLCEGGEYFNNVEGDWHTVMWSQDSVAEFMSEPLFSKHGLNWISDEYGQNLLEAIFDCLKGAASRGKNRTSIMFKLTSHGWYFVNDVGYHYPSCMPDDLVEIVEMQGFIVSATSATSRSYTIKVKW